MTTRELARVVAHRQAGWHMIGGAGHAQAAVVLIVRGRGPGCQATDFSLAQAVEAEREDLVGDGDLGERSGTCSRSPWPRGRPIS